MMGILWFSNQEVKRPFYDSLERLYDSLPPNDVKILVGDSNAKSGNILNDNGPRRIDFAVTAI